MICPLEAAMSFKLTYPIKSHETEDLQPYYEEFKRLNPDLFSKWRDYALGSRIEDREFPKDVSTAAIEFLRGRFDYESEAALISGYGDFGRLLYRELHFPHSEGE
jgi:hypothetical protein